MRRAFAATDARERYSRSIARAKASALPRRNMRGVDLRSLGLTAYRLRADNGVQPMPEAFHPFQQKRENDR